MKKIWLFVIICLIGAYTHWHHHSIDRPPGILAPDPPKQRAMHDPVPTFEKQGYHIKPLATFEVEARVLLKENYWLGREADLSPVDLALGWGRMSDSMVLKHFDFKQSGRFYYWQAGAFPIPRSEVETHTANMHMIPATNTVEKRLNDVRPGHVIKLRGFLAEVRADDGWHWRSSLTRNDTGDGACEVVWVENLEVF